MCFVHGNCSTNTENTKPVILTDYLCEIELRELIRTQVIMSDFFCRLDIPVLTMKPWWFSFNIRVTTLAGHEVTLKGSQPHHSAECFLFWS